LLLFHSVTCIIRTVGGYVLLRKVVSNKAVLFISLLYLNTILTSFMMMPDIVTEGLYSFLPLLFYYILCFFEDLRLRPFLLAVLVMALGVVSSPLFALGYFYQAVHFFILSCVIFFLSQRGWRGLDGREVLPRVEFLKNMGLVACCCLIILPYVYWGHSLLHDFYVSGSGLGGTQGGFNNIFNFKGYFNLFNKGFANSFEFLGTSLDYHHNFHTFSWVFMGASSLFLALMGIVLSKDKRKYIFAGSILGVILINNAWFPGNFSLLEQYIQYAQQAPAAFWARGMHLHDGWSYGFLMLSTMAHGINVLTNPFCFLVRSFHMTSLLVPMMLLPLVAMGLESCLCLWQDQRETIHFNRRWGLVVFFAVVLLWALSGGTQSWSVGDIGQAAAQTLKWYILSVAAIFFLLVLIPALKIFNPQKNWVAWMILGSAFVVDFTALMAYVQFYKTEFTVSVVPTRLNPSYTRQAVVPDYQNPRLLPWREFFNVQSTPIYPVINSISGMYGAFYQYTPMGRFFLPASIYEPRHISYKDLHPDLEIQQYLAGNPRTVFFADDAFDSRYIRMADILRLNLGQRVIAVDQEPYNNAFLKNTDHVYIPPVDLKERIYDVSLDWKQARMHKRPEGWEYSFDLPKDFPFYLSTTVFTYDYTSWRLMVGDRILDPIQGKLTAPFTYDVQNVQDRKLTVLLPDQESFQAAIRLQVKLPGRVLNVWKNTYDDLGLTYEAPKDGWLVFNYPYDEKWELSIDGQQTPISKVNRYFIGSPIKGGEHQILLRYWPQTHLRFLIFISMVLSVICLGGIIYDSIKREPLYRGQS